LTTRSTWPPAQRTSGKIPTGSSLDRVEFRDRITDLVVTQERKVVVFSQGRRMLRLAQWVIADVLARAGVRMAFFTRTGPDATPASAEGAGPRPRRVATR
jgi:hypothetical protein